MMTTSAASDEAVAPRAPIATPTSAAARAGASLMPSPTMTVGPPSRALGADGLDLLGRRALGEHAIEPDRRRDALGDVRVVAGDHDDPAEAGAAEGAERPWRLGPDRVARAASAPASSPSTATKTSVAPRAPPAAAARDSSAGGGPAAQT